MLRCGARELLFNEKMGNVTNNRTTQINIKNTRRHTTIVIIIRTTTRRLIIRRRTTGRAANL